MKKVQRLCLAALLAVTFTLSASAGEIECGVTNPPPPPAQPTSAADETAPTVTASSDATGITEAVLTALESALTLF